MKTIYFDFDGTIHNTAIIYQNAVNEAYKFLQTKMQLEDRVITKEECNKWLGLTPIDMWNDFMPNLDENLKKEASTLVGNKMRLQLENGYGVLYEGAEETLQALIDKEYQLKILSNCKKTYGKTIMKVFGLDKYIKQFHTAEEYDYKPKYEILSLIKGNDEIVGFVGDRKADIDAGKHHNILTVGCTYGFGSSEELKDSSVLINDIKELKRIFE